MVVTELNSSKLFQIKLIHLTDFDLCTNVIDTVQRTNPQTTVVDANVDGQGTVYVADSASSRNGQHPGWEYGIRIGNLRDGSLVAFINGSNPEGVAVAPDGTVYGAVVAFGGALLKYVSPDHSTTQR